MSSSFPQPPEAQARRLAGQGRWGELAGLCRRWQAQAPDLAHAHYFGGVAALEQRQLRAALEQLTRAVALAPQEGDIAAEHARALSLAHRQAQALEEARRALPLCAAAPRALGLLGVVFSRAGDHAQAERVFRAAAALDPDDPGHQFNLAAARKFLGDFDGAERAYQACIAAQPTHWRAQSALALLRRARPEQNRIDALTALLPDAAGQPEALAHVHHALSRQYEDLGQYDQAWRHLLDGKREHRARLGDVGGRDAALFDALERAFPDAIAAPDDAPEGPIFIVGMPRSGTTLVDRILSSHPQVQAAGELQVFGVALKRASGSPTRALLDPETITRAAGLDWAALGQDYLHGAAPMLHGGEARFTDKLPHNFLYAGFIARALPRARIVCLQRDPLDVCLGNLRTLFAMGTPYFHYASDPLDTARYVRRFERLMAHWQRVLPGRFLRLGYERLVEDQQAQTRALLAFCGLPYDPACLDFHHNPAPVATASATQVRGALNRDGIGRWQRYAAHLEPLRRILEA